MLQESGDDEHVELQEWLDTLEPSGGTVRERGDRLITAAAWPYSQPPEALLAAYAADPSVAAMRVDFTDLLRQTLAVAVSGLLARGENKPVGASALETSSQRAHE